MNPLHVDLFLTLLFLPFEWIYTLSAAKGLGTVIVGAVEAAVVLVFASIPCCGLLVAVTILTLALHCRREP